MTGTEAGSLMSSTRISQKKRDSVCDVLAMSAHERDCRGAHADQRRTSVRFPLRTRTNPQRHGGEVQKDAPVNVLVLGGLEHVPKQVAARAARLQRHAPHSGPHLRIECGEGKGGHLRHGLQVICARHALCSADGPQHLRDAHGPRAGLACGFLRDSWRSARKHRSSSSVLPRRVSVAQEGASDGASVPVLDGGRLRAVEPVGHAEPAPAGGWF